MSIFFLVMQIIYIFYFFNDKLIFKVKVKNMISKVSKNLALRINSHTISDDPYSFEKIKYSLDIILGEISKFVILIALFFLTNSLSEFLISFIIFSLIKPFSGGIHFSTYGKCLMASIVFFGIVVFLSKTMILLPNMFYIPIFIILVSLIYFYSPAKSVYRKFHTPEIKQRMKNITGIMSTLIAAISIFSGSLLIINSSMFTMLLIIMQLIFLYERRFL